MQLPEFLNLGIISQIVILVVGIIQYFKPYVPEWIIKPYLQIVLGVGWSIAIIAYTGTITNWVFVITNGVLAGLLAEGGYQILSNFGLKSKGE